jgi:hypothetical protein
VVQLQGFFPVISPAFSAMPVVTNQPPSTPPPAEPEETSPPFESVETEERDDARFITIRDELRSFKYGVVFASSLLGFCISAAAMQIPLYGIIVSGFFGVSAIVCILWLRNS